MDCMDFLGRSSSRTSAAAAAAAAAEDEAGAQVLLAMSSIKPEVGMGAEVDTRLSLGSLPYHRHEDTATAAAEAGGAASGAAAGGPLDDKKWKEHLFSKALKKSDVNKLNRLVIPKHHAKRCFPHLRQDGEGEDNADESAKTAAEMLMSFRDDQEQGKDWVFNYKYWGSSKTYVFSRGWIKYIKHHQLLAGDEVSFYRDKEHNQMSISFNRTPHLTQADRDEAEAEDEEGGGSSNTL